MVYLFISLWEICSFNTKVMFKLTLAKQKHLNSDHLGCKKRNKTSVSRWIIVFQVNFFFQTYFPSVRSEEKVWQVNGRFQSCSLLWPKQKPDPKSKWSWQFFFLHILSSTTIVNGDRTGWDRTRCSPVDKCRNMKVQRSPWPGALISPEVGIRDKLQEGAHTRGSELTQLYIVI